MNKCKTDWIIGIGKDSEKKKFLFKLFSHSNEVLQMDSFSLDKQENDSIVAIELIPSCCHHIQMNGNETRIMIVEKELNAFVVHRQSKNTLLLTFFLIQSSSWNTENNLIVIFTIERNKNYSNFPPNSQIHHSG